MVSPSGRLDGQMSAVIHLWRVLAHGPFLHLSSACNPLRGALVDHHALWPQATLCFRPGLRRKRKLGWRWSQSTAPGNFFFLSHHFRLHHTVTVLALQVIPGEASRKLSHHHYHTAGAKMAGVNRFKWARKVPALEAHLPTFYS